MSNNSFTITGQLIKVYPIQEFSRGFSKREFVIRTHGEYPQDIKFELVKDKTFLTDQVQSGADVTVHFNIRGNEYKERFYVNLQAWKLEPASGESAPAPSTRPTQAKEPTKQGGKTSQQDMKFYREEPEDDTDEENMPF
jgi:hypothetical protein